MKSLCLLLALSLSVLAEDSQWVDDKAIVNAKKALVNVQVEASTSFFGFFASEEGLIVVPASPLEDAKQVVITTSANEKITDCRLMAIDLDTNVAVLATGKTPPSHVTVSSRSAAVGEVCAMVFGFTSDQEAKVSDGKLLARHEGLNQKQRGFTDFWFAARSPSATGVMGGVAITRDGNAAGMCFKQLVQTAPVAQEIVVIVPETAIATLLVRAHEAHKPLIFPLADRTSDEGIAAADPDASAATVSAISGDYQAAIEKYRIALRREPHNTVIMHGLVQCLLGGSNFGEEQMAEAKALLEKASSLNPKHLNVRLLLGQVLGRMGDTKNAIQSMEALTREFPKFAEAWAVLADILQHDGRDAEAVAVVKKCADLEPEWMSAWSFYADTLAKAGKLDEASRARERVHELESLYFKLKYSAPHRK